MQVAPLIAALLSIVLSVLGQFALKQGTRAAAAGAVDSEGFASILGRSLMQPSTLLGLGLYAAGAVLWVYVLSHWDVSKAYPMVGCGFVLTLAVGSFVFGEAVSIERWVGCGLICVGLLLMARS